MRHGFVCATAALLAAVAFPAAAAPAPATRPMQPTPSPGAMCDNAIAAAERAGGATLAQHANSATITERPGGALPAQRADSATITQRAGGAARPPPGLLGAIGMAESGRLDPRTGRAAPWPWTINIAGEDHVFDTKADAIAAVLAAQAAGVQSIDVGCMQVNLMYHPAAFASLEQAFDPQANVAYAQGFLGRLFAQLGDWPHAAAAYHSQTPGIGEAYGRRVMALWPLAAQFGGDLLGPPDAAPASSAATAKAREDAIDPNHVYTAAFRARLAQDAADRARRVAMGLVPPAAPPAGRPATPPRLALSGLAPSNLAPSNLASSRPASSNAAARLAAMQRPTGSTHLARAGS